MVRNLLLRNEYVLLLQAEVRALKLQLTDLKASKDQLLTKYTAKENRAPAKRPVKHSGVQAGDDTAVSELQSRLEEQAQELASTQKQLQDAHQQAGLQSAPVRVIWVSLLGPSFQICCFKILVNMLWIRPDMNISHLLPYWTQSIFLSWRKAILMVMLGGKKSIVWLTSALARK